MKRSDRTAARGRLVPGSVLSLALAAAASACAGEVTGGEPGEGDALTPGLQPPVAAAGSVEVTLHPGAEATVGQPAVISFAAPFPRGALADASLLRAVDQGGEELPVHAEEILPWRSMPGGPEAGASVRAAMVSVEVTLAERAPRTITLEYGAAPSATLEPPADPRADWVPVKDGEYPSGAVREPRVYASFPADWLSSCLLRGRTTEVGADSSWSWYDESLIGSAHTAVNDVPAQVTQTIDHLGDFDPWLFDRSATLFGVYVRTGDVKWLRHAHRSAQYYLSKVTPEGYFGLKDGDLKYAYGRSLLLDFVLTGDPALVDAIERVAAAASTWNPTYDLGVNFWTERHQTYALLAALAAWQATGKQEHADRVKQIVDASFALAAQPPAGWKADGCMLHGMTAHEGAGGDVPVCSPWMSALFGDAVWEYYTQSGDEAALEFLDGLGQYVVDHGLYGGGDGLDFTMPWYLASSAKTFSDAGPWGDVEHTCDVAGLVARAAYARDQLGSDPAELRAAATELVRGCQYDLNMWHRPDGMAEGLAEWRLAPARKFNWWFGTTLDMPWLLEQVAE
ncbi:MAG TPA: hypothetical protein VKZ63_08390 [Kofleriaceae bacterium]|nr:hypothetical protein [Kofleriaceae bacterium]